MKIKIKMKYWLKIANSKITLKILKLFRKTNAIYQKQAARDILCDERNVRVYLLRLCKYKILYRKTTTRKIILYSIVPGIISQ